MPVRSLSQGEQLFAMRLRVKEKGSAASAAASTEAEVRFTSSVTALGAALVVKGNYPNPFRERTTLRVDLPYA